MKLLLYAFYGTMSLVGCVATLAYFTTPEIRIAVKLMWMTEW